MSRLLSLNIYGDRFSSHLKLSRTANTARTLMLTQPLLVHNVDPIVQMLIDYAFKSCVPRCAGPKTRKPAEAPDQRVSSGMELWNNANNLLLQSLLCVMR